MLCKCFVLSYAIWVFPNADETGSCLHTADVKSFYTNLSGKENITRTKIFIIFICLFLQILIGCFSSGHVLEKQPKLPGLYSGHVCTSDTLNLCFSAPWAKLSDHFPTKQPKWAGPVGMKLFASFPLADYN